MWVHGAWVVRCVMLCKLIKTKHSKVHDDFFLCASETHLGGRWRCKWSNFRSFNIITWFRFLFVVAIDGMCTYTCEWNSYHFFILGVIVCHDNCATNVKVEFLLLDLASNGTTISLVPLDATCHMSWNHSTWSTYELEALYTRDRGSVTIEI